jgi:hypothetical protein
MSYPQPSYPSPYEEILEEDSTTVWWLIGCGAIITLVGLCVCSLIFSVAFLNALSRATPTPFLAAGPQQPTSAPVPQEPAQPISTPFPSPPPPLTPPPAPQHGKVGVVGQRFEASGIGLTVNSVSREAKEGLACVTVDVTIENIGRNTVSYSPLHFKIKDSQGLEYTTACGPTNDQGLKSGELSQGGKVQGKVSFRVAESATDLLLVYQELALSGGHDIIEIDLGP